MNVYQEHLTVTPLRYALTHQGTIHVAVPLGRPSRMACAKVRNEASFIDFIAGNWFFLQTWCCSFGMWINTVPKRVGHIIMSTLTLRYTLGIYLVGVPYLYLSLILEIYLGLSTKFFLMEVKLHEINHALSIRIIHATVYHLIGVYYAVDVDSQIVSHQNIRSPIAYLYSYLPDFLQRFPLLILWRLLLRTLRPR